jgi:hypothetical protein
MSDITNTNTYPHFIQVGSIFRQIAGFNFPKWPTKYFLAISSFLWYCSPTLVYVASLIRNVYHIIRQTHARNNIHTLRFLRNKNRRVTETATYINTIDTRDEHLFLQRDSKRRYPGIEQPQTYTLDHMTFGIS